MVRISFSLTFLQSQDYEYVMDEEIEFVQALQMEGSRKDKVSIKSIMSISGNLF